DLYATLVNAKPQALIRFVIVARNYGDTVLDGVQVADGLPPDTYFVPDSTLLVDSLTGPAGTPISDNRVTSGGITIDNLDPGASEDLYFEAVLGSNLPAGANHLNDSATVRAEGTDQIFNDTFVDV